MKSYKNICLLVFGMIVIAMAFTSCSKGVAPPPSSPHQERIHGESRWN